MIPFIRNPKISKRNLCPIPIPPKNENLISGYLRYEGLRKSFQNDDESSSLQRCMELLKRSKVKLYLKCLNV